MDILFLSKVITRSATLQQAGDSPLCGDRNRPLLASSQSHRTLGEELHRTEIFFETSLLSQIGRQNIVAHIFFFNAQVLFYEAHDKNNVRCFPSFSSLHNPVKPLYPTYGNMIACDCRFAYQPSWVIWDIVPRSAWTDWWVSGTDTAGSSIFTILLPFLLRGSD